MNLFFSMEGVAVSQIAEKIGLSRQSVYETIDKALAFGPILALKDLSGRGAPAEISDDDKAWVLSIACQSPKNPGYAYELWTKCFILTWLLLLDVLIQNLSISIRSH